MMAYPDPIRDFVALDFELANPKRGSIIQIGVARVIDGQVESTACEPVRPHPTLASFSPRSMQIHGLGPEYVRGAQEWPQALDRLWAFADDGELPIVAHNASVERSAIEQACLAWEEAVPEFEYHCTMQAAKTMLAPEYAGPYGLEALVSQAGLDAGFRHHDAGEDARVTAELVLAWSAQAPGPHRMRTLWYGAGRLRPRSL